MVTRTLDAELTTVVVLVVNGCGEEPKPCIVVTVVVFLIIVG